MGIIDFLRKFCIMKNVREKLPTESENQVNRNNEKVPYVGIMENIFLPNKEIKIEEIGKEIGENINEQINKLSKKNLSELNSIYEDVKNEKNIFEKKVNLGFGDKDYEKIKIIYSGFDILLSAIAEETEKRKTENNQE